MKNGMRRGMRTGFVAAVFAAGWLCGTTLQPAAQAQLGELGKDAMKKAGDSGGALGQTAQLGTTITEMQDSVTKLQKNLEVLNTIKAALGG